MCHRLRTAILTTAPRSTNISDVSSSLLRQRYLMPWASGDFGSSPSSHNTAGHYPG
jgi:hypothetical protein